MDQAPKHKKLNHASTAGKHGTFLFNLGVGKGFLTTTQKPDPIKEKINLTV